MRPTFRQSLCLGAAALTLLGAPGVMAAAPTAVAQPAPPATPAPPTAPAPAAAAAPAGAPVLEGPLVPGVCTISRDGIIVHSKLGLSAAGQVQELVRKTQADLTAEAEKIQARSKALEAKRATISPLQFQTEAKALQQREQTFQASQQDRARAVEAQKQKIYADVIAKAQPYLVQAYASHKCGLLLASEAVVAGNMGNDLTGEITKAMDAASGPLTFQLTPTQPPKP
jgi:Skp family chaperone for outer membrane proteins